MINGAAVVEGGGKTILMRKSLDMAAEALVQGQGIPEAAQDIMARPVVPHWLYRLLGGMGRLDMKFSTG